MFDVDPTLLQKYRDSVDLTNFPRQFKKWYEHATDAEKDLWYEERFKALKYHLYLSGFVPATKTGDPNLPVEYVPLMGMDFQPDPHAQLFAQLLQMRPGENLVLSDLDTEIKKRMVLWPRGLFKTSAIIVAAVQLILNYPNIRICFLTGGDKLAARQLARVKRVFERPTKRFMFLFPEFCLRDIRNKNIKDENDARAWSSDLCKLGNAHEFTVPCRTNDAFAEPTFAISSAKSVKAGSHYDVIIIDDLVNDQNYRNVKLLEKSYQDYLDICPVLDPAGFILMTGTRYSFGDTYERIQEMAREEERLLGKTIWRFSIRDCWSMGCSNCEHTDVYQDYTKNILQPPCSVQGCRCPGFHANGSKGVLFPHTRTVDGRVIGHTLEFLEGERVRLGPEFFANQYENKPIATGAQTFTETLIGRQTLHHINQLPTYSQGYTFVVGDLAYVGQEGRDYSVVYVCRKSQGRIYIVDCLFGNWDSATVAENTINILLRHRPSDMFYEKFNGWEAYNNVITAYAKEKGVPHVPLQWLKGSQSPNAKLIRIGAVKGPLEAGRLWLYAGIPGYDRLVKQLTKWPKLGRHDDFADCCGMVAAAPTGYELETPPQTDSTLNWLRKLGQQPPGDDSYYDGGCGSGLCC